MAAMNQDETFMSLVFAEARKSLEKSDYPFGSIVVRNNKVVGSGHSREVSENDVTRHAELEAISSACRNLGTSKLNDCAIYASGEPCTMCSSAIFQAKIPLIFIGSTRDDLPNFFRNRKLRIFDLAKDCSYTPKIITGVLKEEAIKLFDKVNK